MRYDFDENIERKGTHSIKYDAFQRSNPLLPTDTIPLWVADTDFACPPPVLAAMQKRLDRRILGYSTIYDDPAYGEAVCGWMRRRYGWATAPEQILFSDGIVPALFATVELETKPGDEVLFLTPAYKPFDMAVRHYGRTPLYSRMREVDGYYTIDWDDFSAKAKRDRCTLCFLCNPQNPTGRVFTEEELLRIGKILLDNNVFIVSDEIHADIVRCGRRHIPFAKLFPQARRIVTCTAPSKTFNIAGNALANLFIPDPAVYANWASRALLGHPCALSIDATIAAYNECEDWLEQLKTYLDGNFAAMETLLAEELPQAKFRTPEGTYLGWVDLGSLGVSERQLDETVSRSGVYVQFGKDFVDNGNCFARVNAGCPRAVLEKGLRRMTRALMQFC